MASIRHLQVDLADPDDIRAKLPEARRLYIAKRQELDDLTEQTRYWAELVELLARVAGSDSSAHADSSTGKKAVPTNGRAPGQDRAVAALERAGKPMGPTMLYRFMIAQGMDAPKNANALGANLWAAMNAGRVKKVEEGIYAPLSWESSTASPAEPLQLPGPASNGSPTAAPQTSPHAQTLSDGGGRPREPEDGMAAPS